MISISTQGKAGSLSGTQDRIDSDSLSRMFHTQPMRPNSREARLRLSFEGWYALPHETRQHNNQGNDKLLLPTNFFRGLSQAFLSYDFDCIIAVCMFFLLLHLYDMTRPNRAQSGLPYKSHPLYKLRYATIITGIVGFILNLIAILALISDDSENIPYFVFSVILLLCSLVLVLHDLVRYAVKTAIASNRDHLSEYTPTPVQLAVTQDEPEWPSKRLVILDFILAFLFFWLFWATFFGIINSWHRYYHSGGETFEAYANLANLAASIEHAIAFWKELMARKKAAWRRDVEASPCQNCGHVNPTSTEKTTQQLVTATEQNEGESSGPSIFERFGKGIVMLPKWARGPDTDQYNRTGDRDIEGEAAGATATEPLLRTPDESSTEVGGPSESQGYGTLAQSVDSVSSVPEQIEQIVKKKDKGKKRVVEVK